MRSDALSLLGVSSAVRENTLLLRTLGELGSGGLGGRRRLRGSEGQRRGGISQAEGLRDPYASVPCGDDGEIKRIHCVIKELIVDVRAHDTRRAGVGVGCVQPGNTGTELEKLGVGERCDAPTAHTCGVAVLDNMQAAVGVENAAAHIPAGVLGAHGPPPPRTLRQHVEALPHPLGHVAEDSRFESRNVSQERVFALAHASR